ncbi:MAG: MarC family protein [Micrococcaceae bacterium]
MDIQLFSSVFITLIVIMDPPGTVPIFMSLTSRMTTKERNHAALQAVMVATGVIVAFALFGQQILNYMHISLPAMRMAGGLLLILIALELLTVHHEDGETQNPVDANIAFVPLGTPLLAGPGAIVAIMVFVQGAPNVADQVSIALAVLAVLVVLYLALRFATVIKNVLGDTGVDLLTRIAGLLLCAIAVQMMADAAFEFFQSWQKVH